MMFRTGSEGDYGTCTYLCCDFCGKPITGAWKAVWYEDKNGKQQEVKFVHWKCGNVYALMQPDKEWLQRGCPTLRIAGINKAPQDVF